MRARHSGQSGSDHDVLQSHKMLDVTVYDYHVIVIDGLPAFGKERNYTLEGYNSIIERYHHGHNNKPPAKKACTKFLVYAGFPMG
jgi:hypothetical protein